MADFIIYLLTCKPVDVTNFAVFDDRPYFGEPLLVPFYTSLNADISGTRKDIKKRSTVFFPVFLVLSYKKNKDFHFISTLVLSCEDIKIRL